MQQRFRPWRATWNVDINRDVAIDAFKHVIALFEWATGNCTGTHGNDVFRIRHLVVEPHNLRRHFLGHCPGNDHQIGLTRRWPENFAAEPSEVVARRGGGNHLDGATRQPELQGPDRASSTPIVKVLYRGHPDPLSLQFAAKPFVDLPAHVLINPLTYTLLTFFNVKSHFAQFKHPLLHAQTSPSISNSRKTMIAMKAPTGKPVKATANGTRKIASTSKMRKMIAYK